MILITTFEPKHRRALVGAVALILAVAGLSFADSDTREKPIADIGTASTVSVSTSVWTKLPAASTLSRRSGVKINNPSTNSAGVGIVIATGTPGVAITVRPIEIGQGENPFIPVGDGFFPYAIAIHTSAESVHVQEVRQ